MNKSSMTVSEPVDPREVVRARCLRVGAVDDLTKGKTVWVFAFGQWAKAKVIRRLPGGVYYAEFCTYPGNGQKTVVAAAVYGGIVEGRSK